MIRDNIIPLCCAITGVGMFVNVNSALSFNTGIFLMLVACLIWMRRQEQQG